MWIGMCGDYGTIACPEAYARSDEEAAHPDEWIGIMIGGTVLLIALLFWLFVRRMYRTFKQRESAAALVTL
jgi:hypothetical protein